MSPRTAVVLTKETTKAALVVGGEFKLEALENGERQQVVAFDTELRKAMGAFTDATLKMGEALSGIQKILEPRNAFTAYLKSLPGLSRATAYRYIGYFENLQKRLPNLILVRVVSAGIPMTGTTEKQPFGRYTKAFKKTPLPKGILTDERADAWVQSLQEKHRGMRKTAQVKSATELQTEATNAVLTRFNRVPEAARIAWLRTVFADIGNNVGLDINMALKPAVQAEAAATILERTFATAQPAGKGKVIQAPTHA